MGASQLVSGSESPASPANQSQWADHRPPATAIATPRYGTETLVSARPDPQERAKHCAAGTAVDYAEGIRLTSPCSSRYRRCFQFFTAVPSRKSVVDERLMTARPQPIWHLGDDHPFWEEVHGTKS